MDRSRKIVRVSIIGIVANLILVAFKAFVGLLSGSIAVILDAVNNLSDALSSVITIIGTKLAARPPDKKHPYGYGRIENISSVTIAVIVLLAGLTSFKESLEKIIHPEAASYSIASLIIIAAAVVVKFALGRYVTRAGKQYRSESLVASGTDAMFDSVISLSTLVAAGISLLWHISLEGYLGVVISAVIIKAGVEILMDSLNGIIGARVDGAFAKQLKDHINAYEEVLGTYDLVLHRYGPEKTIGSAHIEVEEQLSAKELHHLTRRIAEDVYREFGIVLTVGIYATNTGNAASAELKQGVLEVIAAYPEILQLHGFYVDDARARVSFDLIIAFGSNAAEIRDAVLDTISKRYPQYTFDILLDSDFSD